MCREVAAFEERFLDGNRTILQDGEAMLRPRAKKGIAKAPQHEALHRRVDSWTA